METDLRWRKGLSDSECALRRRLSTDRVVNVLKLQFYNATVCAALHANQDMTSIRSQGEMSVEETFDLVPGGKQSKLNSSL